MLKQWQFDRGALLEYFDFLREPNNEIDISNISVRDSMVEEGKVSFNYFLRKYKDKRRFKGMHDEILAGMVKSKTDKN